jgi:geranylgeranyl pyrophosphate synthase
MLHALNHPQVGARFAELLEGEMTPERLLAALQLLQEAQSQRYVVGEAEAHFAAALAALDEGLGDQAQASRLRAVAEWLLKRNA